VTDLGVYEPDPATAELRLVALQPGATIEAARAATGWDLRVADDVATLPAPTDLELATLRGFERAAG
jgi:glutaconate CoA-transferase subunit B